MGEPIFMKFEQENHIGVEKLRELFIAEFKTE